MANLGHLHLTVATTMIDARGEVAAAESRSTERQGRSASLAALDIALQAVTDRSDPVPPEETCSLGWPCGIARGAVQEPCPWLSGQSAGHTYSELQAADTALLTTSIFGALGAD